MSKAIVEAHNGEMWMESTLDQGSTFSFALPGVIFSWIISLATKLL